MKFYVILLIITFSIQSCQSQHKNEVIYLKYKAQTRGFLYEIELKDTLLTIIKSYKTTKIKLSKKQYSTLKKLINDIDFSTIKNSSETDGFASDREIAVTFTATYHQKKYNYQFIHQKLPIKIQKLITYFEKLE